MQNLPHLIHQLESKIAHYETKNLAISGGSVGKHIYHSLKTIAQIVTASKKTNPKTYQWKFNLNRLFILDLLNKIPRGKAKAPKIVHPKGEITMNSLVVHLEKVKENLNYWNDLNKNAFFPHPYFGNLNKKSTEKFLVVHTNHHLMIINDILKTN